MRFIDRLLASMFFLCASAIASDVTLLHTQVSRTEASPNIYHLAFTGVPGTASLVIVNGSQASGTRVTSARVTLNGNSLLDPFAFKRHEERMELAVQVITNNELTVELEGKPGTFLTINVNEASPNDVAAGTWTRVTDMLTPRLAGTAGTGVVNGKIIVVGDHDGNPGSGTVNEEYDPVNDVWRAKSPYPRSEGRLGLNRNAVVNGDIYFIGGANIFDNFATTTVDRYTPDIDTWTLNVATYPLVVQHLGTVSLSNFIYCFGGNSYNGSGYSQAYVFDTNSPLMGFIPIREMPQARFRPRVFVRDGKIWVAGGLANGAFINSIDIYDPLANTWSSGPTLPLDDELRWAGLLSDGQIYAVYGNPIPVVYRFRENTPTWERLAEAPLPQGTSEGFGVTAVGNAIYTFGGGDPKVAITQKFVP